MFRNFYKEKKELSQNDDVKKFHEEWRNEIIGEINSVLPLDRLSMDDDLTVYALYKLLQRFYSERGSDGFEDIVKLWGNLMKKEQDENIKNKIH